MNNWRNVELGSVCEVARGGSPRPIIDYITDSPDGVNWLKIGDVKETDKFFTHAAERIKRSGIPKTREVQVGDLILSNSMSFGRAFITLIDGYIHDGWLRLRCNEEMLDKEYLYYFLTSNLAQDQFKAVATGSVVNNLKTDTVKAVRIDLPPLEEQRKIAAVLSLFDNKIKQNEEINENLLQQACAVFDRFYEESPNQQLFTSLINVLGGGTPKTGNPDFWDGHIPFFTPKDVGAPYTFQTEKYITESGLAHCNSRLYPINTTFVTARGTVGKVSLAGTPMAMNQSCYALASETVDPLLVYFYVLKAVTSLKHKASGAVFDAIVTRDFDSETINILSDDDAKSVLAIIKPMMEIIHNNIEENIRLAALRDSLLPRLMSGELDVSALDL